MALSKPLIENWVIRDQNRRLLSNLVKLKRREVAFYSTWNDATLQDFEKALASFRYVVRSENEPDLQKL